MLFEFEPDPGPNTPATVRIVVETRRDSGNKYEYDSKLKLFRLARSLYSPIHYPGDYGFLPGTIAEDGEPLDVLCLVNAPSFTGCVCLVRPIAVLAMLDRNKPDHKILAVRTNDPRQEQVQHLSDVNGHTLAEIEHFFSIYKDLEGITLTMGGWHDKEAAHQLILASRERYLKQSNRDVTESA